MKKIIVVFALCGLLLLVCVSTGAKECQQGGTLHEAKIAQWKKASYDNKLATCADWISALYLKGYLDINISKFDDVKQYANALVEYIDTASSNTRSLDGEKANAVALIGMMLAGWVKKSDVSLSNTKPSKPFKPLEVAEEIDKKLHANGFLN